MTLESLRKLGSLPSFAVKEGYRCGAPLSLELRCAMRGAPFTKGGSLDTYPSDRFFFSLSSLPHLCCGIPGNRSRDCPSGLYRADGGEGQEPQLDAPPFRRCQSSITKS